MSIRLTPKHDFSFCSFSSIISNPMRRPCCNPLPFVSFLQWAPPEQATLTSTDPPTPIDHVFLDRDVTKILTNLNILNPASHETTYAQLKSMGDDGPELCFSRHLDGKFSEYAISQGYPNDIVHVPSTEVAPEQTADDVDDKSGQQYYIDYCLVLTDETGNGGEAEAFLKPTAAWKPAEWATFETYRTEHPKEELGKSFEKTFNGDVDGIRSKNEVLADLQVNQQTQTDHQPGTTDSDKGNQIINVIDNGTPPRGGNETENHTGSEGRNPKRAGNGKSNKGSKKGKTAQGQAKDSDE
mmetsp:Transcript_45119/g.109813  ORF Transcript_45119/g.109813 Transcript_45119/m.109813 type:complete len:297 (-) Transcript_45119:2531-3421(-)